MADLRFELSVPGKTFFLGEYLALEGGPSLVANTSPRFVLSAAPAEGGRDGRFEGIASQSPGGKFRDLHRSFFDGWDLRFEDPHQGQGGLGASSAQFALLYALRALGPDADALTAASEPSEADSDEWLVVGGAMSPSGRPAAVSEREWDWRRLLEEYRAVAWNGQGWPPSGADVVAQLTGLMTWFDGRGPAVRKLTWDFPEMEWSLWRTGRKLATHEHLREARALPVETLRALVSALGSAWDRGDTALLLTAVRDYGEVLAGEGLVAETTGRILETLRSYGPLKGHRWAAKGCGAMGADILLVVHEAEMAEDIKAWARGQGLAHGGGSRTLDEGLRIRIKKGRR